MDLDKLDFIEKFDLSSLHDDHGNGDNLVVLVKSWATMLLDSPIGDIKPRRTLTRVLSRFKYDFKSEVAKLATLGDELNDSILVTDQGDRVLSLHHKFSKTPIFREYALWYETGDSKLYSYIIDYLWWGKKADYVDPQFQSKAFRQWAEIEYDLERLVIPEHLLQDLHRVISLSGITSVNGLDLDDMNFRHGSGAVSEEKSKALSFKMHNVRYDSKIDREILDLLMDFRSQPSNSLVIPDELLWLKGSLGEAEPSRSYSRLMFVPKDYKSVRSICMEPVTYMWAQQAIMNALVEAIHRNPVYGKMIDIKDQSKNRKSAILASEDLQYATVDLSAASDRIANFLVKRIFDGLLLDLLQGSRTDDVMLPSGHIVKLNKFAPMGSALCFPTQCLIFSSVILLAYRLAELNIDVNTYIRSGQASFDRMPRPDKWTRVYGDDLIVLERQTSAIISLLTTLGFQVNSAKSFFGAKKFRESCGAFALHGQEIDVDLFKVKGLRDKKPTWIQSMIDLINRMFYKDRFHVRLYLMRQLPENTYIISSVTSPNKDMPHHVVGYLNNNYGLRCHKSKTFNDDGVTKLYRIQYPIAPIKGFKSEALDRYSYARWLQSSSKNPERTISIVVPPGIGRSKPTVGDAGKPALRWGWMPA